MSYLDPGNWSVDLSAGSQFGYSLLTVIALANAMATVLQYLCIKLGVVTGCDLAMACRKTLPRSVNLCFYVLCEIAIIATDLAEVIGTAVALQLLVGLPLPAGVLITALDVLVILAVWGAKNLRLFESAIMGLVMAVAGCFGYLLFRSGPNWSNVAKGLIPSPELVTNGGMLYLATGIIGATIMPHNLYIHSSIVRYRSSKDGEDLGEINDIAYSEPPPTVIRPQPDEGENTRAEQPLLSGSGAETTTSTPNKTLPGNASNDGNVDPPIHHGTQPTRRRWLIPHILWYTNMDSVLALSCALLINAAILIVAAAAFHETPRGGDGGDPEEVAELADAYELLNRYLGPAAGMAFALALLFAGQSSTMTGTIAGQVIIEGFLGGPNGFAPRLRVPAWLRRLSTRVLAIVPAMTVATLAGESGMNRLLVASQVVLSLQLPFAIWPLVLITGNKKLMTVTFKDESDATSCYNTPASSLATSPISGSMESLTSLAAAAATASPGTANQTAFLPSTPGSPSLPGSPQTRPGRGANIHDQPPTMRRAGSTSSSVSSSQAGDGSVEVCYANGWVLQSVALVAATVISLFNLILLWQVVTG
ncbi:hypothetical protein HDU96_004069 [Phlyctochytrium bullatum]|nr:hypothetical protein HDU96_004069 [Phlyctochytrium bullatum]